ADADVVELDTKTMRPAPCRGVTTWGNWHGAQLTAAEPEVTSPTVQAAPPLTESAGAEPSPAELDTAEPVVMETKLVAVKVEAQAEAAADESVAELESETPAPTPNPIEPLTYVPG